MCILTIVGKIPGYLEYLTLSLKYCCMYGCFAFVCVSVHHCVPGSWRDEARLQDAGSPGLDFRIFMSQHALEMELRSSERAAVFLTTEHTLLPLIHWSSPLFHILTEDDLWLFFYICKGTLNVKCMLCSLSYPFRPCFVSPISFQNHPLKKKEFV